MSTGGDTGCYTGGDDRLDRLVELVVQLASGELDVRMAPSAAADAVDAVIVGINMLAEELQALYAGLEARVAERTGMLQQAQRQLERLALYDPLTGLANRTLLADRLDGALARGDRTGRWPAVLVLDLDGFKAVNDTHGHDIGDLVLCEVARRVATVARAEDTVARLGGDEFALVVLDADQDRVLAVADRIRSAIQAPVRTGDITCHVGTSIGICLAEPGQSAGALLRNADVAMYSAKLGESSAVEIYRPVMHHEASSRSRFTDELRRAVDASELVLHYQPVVDLQTGRAVGVEALVRWQHPRRGLISPDLFIELAERTGLIVQLGGQVIDTALAALAGWRAGPLGNAPFRIQVNTSPRQLRSPGFVSQVADALARHGIAGADLWLEITGSEMLADDSATARTLSALRDVGVVLVMDDFGTGHASIGYVRRLPVDVIKVDRSLVTGLDTDTQQHDVAAAVLALVDAVGLQAVAEGVETAGESAALRALGYRYAQGYYHGRPAGAEQTIRALRQQYLDEGSNTSATGWRRPDAESNRCGDDHVVEKGADRAARHRAGHPGPS